MRATFEFVGDCTCIIAALAVIMSVMLGMTLLIDMVIHDRIAASVAGVAFTIGVATPLYNNVVRCWMRFTKNTHDVPLSQDEQIMARRQLGFYLLKVSVFV